MKLCSSASGEVSEKDPSSECSVLGTVTRSSKFTFDISTSIGMWLEGEGGGRGGEGIAADNVVFSLPAKWFKSTKESRSGKAPGA